MTAVTAATNTRTGAAPSSPSTTTTASIARQQEAWIKSRQIHLQQLLTEHFGFAPLSFVDDVINSVNNMIYQASMALQEFIESEMENVVAGHYGDMNIDPNLDPKDESGKCMHKFETLLESAVDKNFDRFELYALKNIFGVPEDVDIVLPHYEALDFEIGVEREQKLDDELELLRRQVIATKSLNYRLRKEQRVEENRRRQLEKCREELQFLKDAIKANSDVEPMPQTMIFVRENVEALQRRFLSLHEKLIRLTRPDNQNNYNNDYSSSTSGSLQQQRQQQSRQLKQQYGAVPPPESVTLALHETLAGKGPDVRSVYLRSKARQCIDEQLAMLDQLNMVNANVVVQSKVQISLDPDSPPTSDRD
ncbi:hypothetical protein BG011_001619 [Mortierella polycephala]|uniref:Mis12-domain-containing protein n=1 Tax=Mortierella polycephala TaxID=41804 RepID=A0A9P6Q7T4_9FUNG|nr:hypothetical protein BG011_001619 [Mortierella polycephala]